LSDRRSIRIGRAGEYFVCHILELAGIEATRSDGQFDVIALRPDGTMASVEVKTCATIVNTNRVRFNIGISKADWWALYAMPLGLVLFMRGDDDRLNCRNMTLRADDFTTDAQTKSLRELTNPK
jgi:Holliday junction resolvase-like predicted endonuclease